MAGQVVDNANRFVRPGGSSHLFLLTQGYAVLNDPSMPIVGVDGAEPNDTYIEQLRGAAAAGGDAGVVLGGGGPARPRGSPEPYRPNRLQSSSLFTTSRMKAACAARSVSVDSGARGRGRAP